MVLGRLVLSGGGRKLVWTLDIRAPWWVTRGAGTTWCQTGEQHSLLQRHLVVITRGRTIGTTGYTSNNSSLGWRETVTTLIPLSSLIMNRPDVNQHVVKTIISLKLFYLASVSVLTRRWRYGSCCNCVLASTFLQGLHILWSPVITTDIT